VSQVSVVPIHACRLAGKEELRMRHLSVARLVLLWLHGAAVEATG